MDLAPVYAGIRTRLSELVRANSDRASTPVPACPGWTVKDVVGHLTGVCADILAGNLEGVTTPPWTDAQVSARRDKSLEEVLEEWATVGPQVEALVPMFPGDAATQWVADTCLHEQDVRGALDTPGARDDVAVDVAIEFLGSHLVRAAHHNGMRGLRIRVGSHEWSTDEEEVQATLTAEPFDFLRAAGGRRSVDQLRHMQWDGDPEPYLKAFEWGPFRPAAEELVEP